MEQSTSTGRAAPPFFPRQTGPWAAWGELQPKWASLLGGAAKAQAVQIAPERLRSLQQRYVDEFRQLWSSLLQAQASPASIPSASDRRFSHEAWSANRISRYTAALYLLGARALFDLADSVQADEPTRQKLRFAVQQWVDAAAPSNFLALNPEAIDKAVRTQGESLRAGVNNWLKDLKQGRLTQTDESVFEVGRNVATTAGQVVFENALFQLIEYAPLTEQVHARPLLFVPPMINKYYILDLQPDNSLVRFAVEQGHRTFVMSWRNPDASLGHLTWDDYVQDGAIRAMEVVRDIAAKRSEGTINTLGFCVGGTLLANALAVLQARGESFAHSATLLTTMVDFSDTGILSVYVDEASVSLREATIGKGGLMTGRELATAFSSLRPNDLVWNYVVGNYLKGETPPPFDLLYWNSDSTNLPGPMFAWYLRNTYLENKMRQPGALTVAGAPLNLQAVKLPTYVYASREDHIVPWQTAYQTTQILGGPMRFVLGASGHIAGVINPAKRNKRSHWTSPSGQRKLPAQPQAWLDAATEQPGSWWNDWAQWLAGQAGPDIAAPKKPGNARYKPIEPAPGRYVKVRA
ncbi:MAG: class I poly(R)-hydroxyalkanoic acid synthase [Thiomonas sp.]|uniref:class I poly(R)-hydroxyalkanoic acid synthase n=1 Tax=Thiomonas sp. TaxID=2047785 RepID=UPI002A35D05A|nr:class I poly(R)-hydroxyalkanoic acid synthase [Thiomonas sp.]MDY0330971.1 class I poly(R)-hydroxyalkanoic acid synthase [Thiomonas sp.]